jgi:hypothetical protein
VPVDNRYGDLSLCRQRDQLVLVVYLDPDDRQVRLEITLNFNEAVVLRDKLSLEITELKKACEN